MKRTLSTITVAALPGQKTRGRLRAGALSIPCVLGRGGITHDKREGDGATPAGTHALRRVWVRGDHRRRPDTLLPIRAIRDGDLWCDSPGDRNYNRHVREPYSASHEIMCRDDGLYDYVVEIGWNDGPRRRGRGSAIFLHVARPGFSPTEGCVAIPADAFRKLLPLLGPRTRLVIR
jgi:L,D-peptidoglycan transpeptidase YkuD (ErfK/YbiS/YcfS/YnhG family)